MPTLKLDDPAKAALVALLTAEIENTRYPFAPRTKALRTILAKLEPLPPATRALTQREAYL